METTTEQSTKGGRRSNAGRKKSTDPKKAIFLFIPISKINKIGGEKVLKTILEAHVQTL